MATQGGKGIAEQYERLSATETRDFHLIENYHLLTNFTSTVGYCGMDNLDKILQTPMTLTPGLNF